MAFHESLVKDLPWLLLVVDFYLQKIICIKLLIEHWIKQFYAFSNSLIDN